MKLWLKNNLSKSEECVDTERLACTNLVCYDYFEFFFKVQTALFLSRWSNVFDYETKEPGKVRLLPTSDIVFKLFTKLVRAARRTVESGISSLCDVKGDRSRGRGWDPVKPV